MRQEIFAHLIFHVTRHTDDVEPRHCLKRSAQHSNPCNSQRDAQNRRSVGAARSVQCIDAGTDQQGNGEGDRVAAHQADNANHQEPRICPQVGPKERGTLPKWNNGLVLKEIGGWLNLHVAIIIRIRSISL